MEKLYDVIVVGAGTSGMMAAISAAEQGARVLLIEKNKKAGSPYQIYQTSYKGNFFRIIKAEKFHKNHGH